MALPKIWTKALPGLKKSVTSSIVNHPVPHNPSYDDKRSVTVSSTTTSNFWRNYTGFYKPSMMNQLFHKQSKSPSLMASVANFHTTAPTATSSNNDGNKEELKSTSPGIISSMLQEPIKEKENESTDSKSEEQTKKEGKEQDKKEESVFMKNQRYAKWIMLANAAIFTPIFFYTYGPPKLDDEGNQIEDEYSSLPPPLAYFKRAFAELKSKKEEVVEPYSEKLLPDTLPEPYYQPKYTLVLELFDVLLRPTYDQVTGWRFKKRPGIEYFLQQVGPPLYEIVIFTKETGMTAYPLIDSMDSKGYIMYRLFRDAARYKSGFSFGNLLKGEWPKLDPYYQKDLRYLNRNLETVIQVDCDKRAIETQPNNGLCLKPWDGSSTDTELYDLTAFLRTVAKSDVDDVRPVLEHYSKYEDPLAAFKLAQSRMQEEQEKLSKELQDNKKTVTFGPSSVLKFFTRG